MEYLDFIVPFFSSLVGGGGVLFVGFKLFKQKTEIELKNITALVVAQKEANDLQASNNEIQQKKIDATAEAVNMISEKFEWEKEKRDKFEKEIVGKNGRTEKALHETASAIAGLDGTMKGLKVVIDLILKQNGLNPQ